MFALENVLVYNSFRSSVLTEQAAHISPWGSEGTWLSWITQLLSYVDRTGTAQDGIAGKGGQNHIWLLFCQTTTSW